MIKRIFFILLLFPSIAFAQTSVKVWDGTYTAGVTPQKALKVDGSAVTQPVSGTFWQATQPVSQSGSWTNACTQSGTWSVELGEYTPVSGRLPVDGSGVTQPVSGPLTDTQLRASAVPVSGSLTCTVASTSVTQGTSPWVVNGSGFTQPVSASALPLPTGASTETTLAAIKAKTDNIDVALSTRTKPADQQHVIIDSGSTTVSGTVAATQSGTWTVQPGNTANTTAWKVDGSAVTQPVSGTVTANAGTNLNTSALALDTSVNGLLLAQGSTTLAQTGPMCQTATTTSAPTYVTAKTNPLSTDTGGNLRVSLKDTPSNTNNLNVNIAASAVTQTVTGTVAATQSGTWTVQPGNTANTTAWKVDGSAVTQPVSGTFWQSTQPISAASLPLPSLASTSTKQSDGSQKTQIVDGSGNVASQTGNAVDINLKTSSITLPVSLASVPSHAVTNAGTFAVQASEADGANVTLGAKADAKSSATDTTAITIMQVLKEISAMVQAPPSQAVTNAGTFAVQAASSEADGANVTLGAKADAKSTATDNTAITIMQVLKEISAMVQAPPSQAVTNTGTFAVQATLGAGSSTVGAFTGTTISSASTPGGSVSVTTSSTTLLASNAARKYALIRNVGSDKVFYRLGATAVATDVTLYPGDVWETPQLYIYTGAIAAISNSGTQTVNVIEY